MEILRELDEDKNDEASLQQALGWASVAASRAEICRLDSQLSVSAPQARSMAEAEQEEAAAQLRQLETSVAQQVGHTADSESTLKPEYYNLRVYISYVSLHARIPRGNNRHEAQDW